MCCCILEQKAEDGFAPSALRAGVEAEAQPVVLDIPERKEFL